MLEDKKRIHLIGAGGIGLSGIGRILLKEKKILSGSDTVATNLTGKLEREGMKFFLGQRAKNISKDMDLIIASAAIKENNPELKEKAREIFQRLEQKDQKLLALCFPCHSLLVLF